MDKILIIHSGGIGDQLLALPAMRSFQQQFPLAIPELMGRPERLSLIAFDLKATSLHSSDRAEMAYFYLENEPLPESQASFFAECKAVLAFGKSNLGLLSRNLKRAGAGRVISISSFPPEGLRVHVTDYLMKSMQKEGFGGEGLLSILHLSEEALTWGRNFWREKEIKSGEKILAVHPGSGSRKKNWDLKHFVRVAGWAKGKSRILWILGPAEGETNEIREVFVNLQPLRAEQLPLLKLAGVLKTCSAYLGNDSGITHLASSLGIPTVALFGPTDPSVWGPRGPQVQWIHDPGGLDRIDPEKVIKAVGPLLSG